MPDAPVPTLRGSFKVLRTIDVTPETLEVVAKVLGISAAKKTALKPGKLMLVQEEDKPSEEVPPRR